MFLMLLQFFYSTMNIPVRRGESMNEGVEIIMKNNKHNVFHLRLTSVCLTIKMQVHTKERMHYIFI